MTLFRERDYFFCEHCGAFHFPSASPDGVRLLGEAPEDVKCPVCHVPLLLATLDDHYRGYQCEKCQGILLGRPSFAQTVKSRRARAPKTTLPPQPLNQEELKRRLHCPTCGQAMNTHPYFGPGNIVIDTCDRCNVIWLDYGELGKVVSAPGMDRGAAFQQQEEPSGKKYKKDKRRKKKRGKYKIDLMELLDKFF
jgi:Zn-finger nucleic acid-binding protein